MPTPPKSKPHEITVSSEAFDEFTGALNEAGIKLEPGDKILINLAEIGVKGPINYRQVNLRHQILTEVAKVYEPPMDDDGQKCLTDATHFIDFFDAVYKYCLTGDKPTITKPITETSNQSTNKAGW